MEKTSGTALSGMDAADFRVHNFMVVLRGLSISCLVRPDNGGVLLEIANCNQARECQSQ
jgi:hypothetical protein